MSKLISVKVNGEWFELAANVSLADLMSLLGKDDTLVATALNESFVPRSNRADVVLHDGDSVITFEPITGG
jgi:sulfur carrier protein